ncbi:hypothetical protein SH661x_002945 [Planctomicrobium sp. SH661]|uniref:hypothetical protein n=1 Tax=Planctomicrobium sp. SH661 TaxID=3448124 RepID=UPI003F5B075A
MSHALLGEDLKQGIDAVRKRTLDFIESMRFTDGAYGRYRYAAASSKPTLYSSSYAAMTRLLYRDLKGITEAQREEWVDYLQSHQDDDGLFRDPVIFGEGWYTDDPLWCGRPHLSCHVLTAMSCLGAVAKKPMRWLDQFLNRDDLVRWLEGRDWGKQVAWAGNEVLNVGTIMQYARDFQGNDRCGAAVETIREWMTERCDPKSGLWGVGALDLREPMELSHAVQAAYHFWLLWFYDRQPIPYADKAIVEVLRTQNSQGSFGCGVHNSSKPEDGSACEDIDSIDPLARLMATSKSNRSMIGRSLMRAEPWLLSNQVEDGGFYFMRRQGFSYGHPQLTSEANGGGMFPTWFRTLTLAYLGKALPESVCGQFQWKFSRCPGLQFWDDGEMS